MSENKILFYEKQKFKQPWIIIPVITAPAILLWGLYQQLILHKPFGNHSLSDIHLIILFIVFGVLVPMLFLNFKLETQVLNDGVYVKLFPIHLSYRKISLDNVKEINRVVYNPILDYGGWGLRYRLDGKAYNVQGCDGIKIIYNNGKHILIGSQDSFKLLESIDKILQ